MQFMMAWLVGVLEILVPGRNHPRDQKLPVNPPDPRASA